MKKNLSVLMLCALLCMLPLTGFCTQNVTVLEDFSGGLNMGQPVDLSAYGQKTAYAAIENEALVIKPDYPSIYMARCLFAESEQAKLALEAGRELRFAIHNTTNSDIIITLELFFASTKQGYEQPFTITNTAYLVQNDVKSDTVYMQNNAYIVIPPAFNGFVAVPLTLAASDGDSAGFVKGEYCRITDYSDVSFSNIQYVRMDLRTMTATEGSVTVDDFCVYSAPYEQPAATQRHALPQLQYTPQATLLPQSPVNAGFNALYVILPVAAALVIITAVLLVRRKKV